MASEPQSGERRRGKRGAAPAVVLSVLAHLIVLFAIGLAVPRPVYRTSYDPAPLTLALVRPSERPRAHPPRGEASTAVAAGPALPRLHIVKPSAPPAPPTTPTLAAPASPPDSGPGGGRGASYAPAPLPAEDGGRGVRAMLRGTLGCDLDAVVHLTAEEKARCLKQFGDAARGATPFSAIPGEKLGGFMREAAANARRRDAHDQTVPMTQPVVSCTGPGSNLGGGCLPEEAMTHVRRQ